MSQEMKHFQYAVAELNRIQSTQYTYNECCGDYNVQPEIANKAFSRVGKFGCRPGRKNGWSLIYRYDQVQDTTVPQMTERVVHEIARINQEEK